MQNNLLPTVYQFRTAIAFQQFWRFEEAKLAVRLAVLPLCNRIYTKDPQNKKILPEHVWS